MKTTTKTTIMTHKKTITYSEGGHKYKMTVKVQLGDPYNNGHEDFSITADIQCQHNKRGPFREDMGGCCHEEIAKHFPTYKPFIALHLCDMNGAPMHCISNMAFHMLDSHPEHTQSSSRCTDSELEGLKLMLDGITSQKIAEKIVSVWVVKNGFEDMWKLKANKSIAKLESLTGSKFESKATKSNYTTPTGDNDFSKASIAKMVEDEKKKDNMLQIEKVAKALSELHKDYKKKNAETLVKYRLHCAVVNITQNPKAVHNVIVYTHNNMIVLNWHAGSPTEKYSHHFTEAQYEELRDMIAKDEIYSDYTLENKASK